MKKLKLTLMCLALVLGAVACDDKKKDDTDEPKAEQPADDDSAKKTGDDQAKAAPKDEPVDPNADHVAKVEVAAAGTKFDPPVKPEDLPTDAWYCDMGTVHWAGMKLPEDGKCPVCGMKLKQFDPEAHAAQKKQAVEAKGEHHHEGDDEGEEGHHHDGDEDHHH